MGVELPFTGEEEITTRYDLVFSNLNWQSSSVAKQEQPNIHLDPLNPSAAFKRKSNEKFMPDSIIGLFCWDTLHLNATGPVINPRDIYDLDHKLSLICHFWVMIISDTI